MEALAVSMPSAEKKQRFGMIAARIGSNIAHKLGIAMPLEAPRFSTATNNPISPVRTRVQHKSMVEYEQRGVERVPVKALPGAIAYLTVQDLTALEPELANQVKWVCNHPSCSGKHWGSKKELAVEHGDNKALAEATNHEPNPYLRKAHVYYGVIELPATPEKKNDKGQIVAQAQPAIIMICSDEE